MSKASKLFTAIGLLLLAAAAALVAYNLWDSTRAGRSAEAVRERLAPVVAAHAERQQELASSVMAAEAAEGAQSAFYVPDYVLDPDREMPVEELDGQLYVGILSLPKLDTELPVISEWSYPALNIAPCRYSGSVYRNDMIIAAHNYPVFFGSLKTLSPGDDVRFTDTEGNEFAYRVVEVEILKPSDVEQMKAGEWDLTLFTCTVGGRTRITVRCERAE